MLKQHIMDRGKRQVEFQIAKQYDLPGEYFPYVLVYHKSLRQFLLHHRRLPHYRELNEIRDYISEFLYLHPTTQELIQKLDCRRVPHDDPWNGDFIARIHDIHFAKLLGRSPETASYQPYWNRNLKREAVEAAVSSLPRTYKDTIAYRFGLFGFPECTLRQTGCKFGLTAEAIRSREKLALRQLRHPFRSRNLRDFDTEA